MARVLVVDDEPDLLALVEVQLRRHGHLVALAASGPEALAIVAERGTPDVAVFDVAMPGMNGFELLNAFRAQSDTPDFPVIFLSARIGDDDVETGRGLGALYLTKPYVMNALLSAIEQSLPTEAVSGGSW